jgi:hypothetical protein
MIGAIYARKSTGRTWLAIIPLLLVVAAPPSAAAADRKEMTYEDYSAATAQVTDQFMKIYEENGVRVRQAVILEKCGYKKEADELNVASVTAEKTLLLRLAEDGVKSGKLTSYAAVLLAREGAQSMMVGYRLGYQESFRAMSDHLPARHYEALCKSTLQQARESLKEDSQ